MLYFSRFLNSHFVPSVLFQLEAEDVGPLFKVRVGHDGSGMFDGWFLEKVSKTLITSSGPESVEIEDFWIQCYSVL